MPLTFRDMVWWDSRTFLFIHSAGSVGKCEYIWSIFLFSEIGEWGQNVSEVPTQPPLYLTSNTKNL